MPHRDCALLPLILLFCVKEYVYFTYRIFQKKYVFTLFFALSDLFCLVIKAAPELCEGTNLSVRNCHMRRMHRIF